MIIVVPVYRRKLFHHVQRVQQRSLFYTYLQKNKHSSPILVTSPTFHSADIGCSRATSDRHTVSCEQRIDLIIVCALPLATLPRSSSYLASNDRRSIPPRGVPRHIPPGSKVTVMPLFDVPRCGANLKRPRSSRAKGREAIYNTTEERSLSILARVRLQSTRRSSTATHSLWNFFLIEYSSMSLGEEIFLM